MRLTIRRRSQFLLAGLAAALFSGMGLTSAAAAEPKPAADAESASLSRAGESLPGGDTPIPATAGLLLIGSAGLAWVVRRSAPGSPA